MALIVEDTNESKDELSELSDGSTEESTDELDDEHNGAFNFVEDRDNDAFNFDDWIDEHKLGDIKECFIRYDMTTVSTLKMDNGNYVKLIGDSSVLALASSAIHVAIHKAMLALQEYDDENRIVVFTQNERQSLVNIENNIQHLQQINIQHIYDNVQDKKEIISAQINQYKTANSQKLNEIRGEMDSAFVALQTHFTEIKAKLHEQIHGYEKEMDKIEQDYEEKEGNIDTTLKDTKSMVAEDIKYYQEIREQCDHIATKLATKFTTTPNQQRVNEIMEMSAKCTKQFEQRMILFQQNENVINEYIDNGLELIENKISINIDNNRKQQIMGDIQHLIGYNSRDHIKLCASIKPRLSVFGVPSQNKLSYSTFTTNFKFMISIRDNGLNGMRRSWKAGSRVRILCKQSTWMNARIILMHKDWLHCLFDHDGSAKKMDRWDMAIQAMPDPDEHIHVNNVNDSNDVNEEKLLIEDSFELDESWKTFKVGNYLDCKDRYGKWYLAQIKQHKKTTDSSLIFAGHIYDEQLQASLSKQAWFLKGLEAICVYFITLPEKYNSVIIIEAKSKMFCDCVAGKKCFVNKHRIRAPKTPNKRKYGNGYDNIDIYNGRFGNRCGIDLLCIIDVSGSMKSFDRIGLVKSAISAIIDKFLKHKNDFIGIVLFSDQSKILLPLIELNNSKQKAENALLLLNALHCGGNTALCDGLIEGVNLMKKQSASSPNVVRSVLLFTDGEANRGKVSTEDIINELNKNKKGMNCTINTFGCGPEHNANLLQEIAERGNGMYAYIDCEKSIASTLAECIGGLMGVIAQNINVNIECIHKDVQITNILSKEYIMKYKSQNDDNFSLKMNDLQSGEKRDLLFELQIPTITKNEFERNSIYNLVKISVDYHNVIKGKKESVTKICSIERSENGCSEEKDSNIKYDMQCNRIMTTNAMSEADKVASGDFIDLEKARLILKNAQMSIKNSISSNKEYCQDLIKDMDRCLLNMSDMDAYKSKGSKMLKMNAASHRRQRSCSSTTWSSQEKYSTHSKLSAIKEVDRTYLNPRDL